MPARLQVVMGKGGVGKTTLSTALALAHAQTGERVGLASLSSESELQDTLRAGWGVPPPSLQLIPLDARQILDGLLAKLMPVPGLAHLITAHPAYDAVFRVAPRVKELGVLHRLVVLADESGLDRIVVDGLATGHGAHFLEAPRKSAHLLVGQLRDRARHLDEVLTNPDRIAVFIATTLEEMPVREAVELVAGLKAAGFPLAGILANRAPERVFPSREALPLVESLGHRGAATAIGSDIGAPWRSVQRFARAAAHMEHLGREGDPLLEELRALGLPVVRVPLLPVDDSRLKFIAARFKEGGL